MIPYPRQERPPIVPVGHPRHLFCGYSHCGREFVTTSRTARYCCLEHRRLARLERDNRDTKKV